MSAYTVSPSAGTWWANYEMGGEAAAPDARPATDEESALMDKVVWSSDTDEDRSKLLRLIRVSIRSVGDEHRTGQSANGD